MSVSLILIPAALAAVSAVTAAGGAGILSLSGTDSSTDDERAATADGTEAGPRPIAVRTRMKDPDLLGDALRDLGATHVSVAADEISAVVDDIEVSMTRTPDGVWAAHFQRVDGHELAESVAADIVERLDAAYALHVQQAVATRIRDRAAVAGFEVVSETRDDEDTVTMVLNVKEYL
jgi:hypothetical protein